MLHRVIFASECVGVTGTTTLSIAQILGVSERNNRRADLAGCMMFHQGHVLQVIEGARADIDRLMRVLTTDPRHTGLRVLLDAPIAERRFTEPMALCGDPASLLARAGVSCLSRITPHEARAMLDLREAA